MRVNAIILAAGRGTRMGGRGSKVLLPVAGRPLILHTLDRFGSSREVGRAVLVVPPGDVRTYEALLKGSPPEGLEVGVRPGGARRQDSVRAGLEALDPDCEFVIVHDGARPFAAAELIDRCVWESRRDRSVTAAVPARNTIKTVFDGQVKETLPRSRLWEIQTPQAFPVRTLREAYALAGKGKGWRRRTMPCSWNTWERRYGSWTAAPSISRSPIRRISCSRKRWLPEGWCERAAR